MTQNISICTFWFLILTISFIDCIDNKSSSTNVNVVREPHTKLQEIPGFNTSFVESGPIVIINERVLFISSIYYNGQFEGTNFYTGTGSPYENRILLRDKLKSHPSGLGKYNGDNVYLELPDSIKKFDYLGIWSEAEAKDLGHVLFDSLQKDDIPPPNENYQKTADGRKILRVPRCCRRSSNNCNDDFDFHPNITVHEHNTTHLNNETMKESEYDLVPYNYFYPPDKSFCAVMPDDIHLLLENTSLFIILDTYTILNHDKFCFLITESRNELHMFCKEDEATSNKATIIYQVLTFTSTICFAITAILYWFVFKVKGVHKICFVCYATMMTLTFLLMAINQLEVNIACSVIGSFFILFINSSYGFLFCLCWDLQYFVKNHKESDSIDYKRLYIYIGASFAYAILVLVISLAPDGLPDVPNVFDSVHGCQYKDTNQYIFFVPLLLEVLFSLGCLIYCGILIKEKNKVPDYSWMKIAINVKYMIIQSGLTLLLMFIFILWPIIKHFDLNHAALDYLSYLQGFLILCLYCCSLAHNKMQTKKKRQLKNKQVDDETGRIPLNQYV